MKSGVSLIPEMVVKDAVGLVPAVVSQHHFRLIPAVEISRAMCFYPFLTVQPVILYTLSRLYRFGQ